MGKGTIQSHLGKGQYSVKLLLHGERVEQRIEELTDAINQVDLVELAAAETALTDAQAVLDQAIADQDAAIATREREKMAAAAITVAKKAAARDKARVERDWIKLRLASLKKAKAYFETNMPDDPVVEAWCADFTENLTGEVATVEIPGERNGVPPLIRPGHNGAAVYDPARDGQLQPAVAHTAPGVFYHWALRAAWQKWKPTYRIGTITSLSGDTGDVALDQALSSDQNLPINQTDILVGVPIVYMSCNGTAFKLDDRVVVEFQGQDWEQPRVIGFESHPRSCPANIIWDPTYPSVPTGYFWSVTGGCTDNTCTWDFVDNGSYSFSGQGTKTLLPGEPNETSININGSFSHTHDHSMAHGTGDCPGIPYGPESWDHGTMSLADNRLITGFFPWSTETIYRRDQALNVTKTAGQNSGQSTDSVEKLVSAEWNSGTHHRTLVWHIQDKTTQYLVNDQAQETVTTLTRTTVVDETGTTTTDSNQTTTERTYDSDPFGPGSFTTDSEGGDCVPVETITTEASGFGWPDPEDTSPVFG